MGSWLHGISARMTNVSDIPSPSNAYNNATVTLYPPSSAVQDAIDGRWEIQVNGVTIFFGDMLPDEDAYFLREMFAPFPSALLSYLFENKTLGVFDHEDFVRRSAGFEVYSSPSLGANYVDDYFVVDRDLLESPNRAGKAHIAIWYALGAFIARELNDIEDFEMPRFQAEFVRYVRARVAAHGRRDFDTPTVDPLFRVFFDIIFDAEIIDRDILRSKYAAIMGVDVPSESAFSLDYLPMSSGVQAMFRPGFWNQIYEQGFRLNIGNDIALSLGMLNTRERTRPESTHELRFLFYSRWLNEAASSFLSVGDWRPAALLTAGVTATYQTQRPEASKQGRIFLGAGFDLGVDPESGWILHSYVGLPVFVSSRGVEDESWEPYWEAGIVRLGDSDKLFVGASITASLYDPADPNSRYIGLVVRYEN